MILRTASDNAQRRRPASPAAAPSPQFVTIKLDKPAVVGTITFGKYHKGHVCNLREFKVYAGLSPDTMVEILHRYGPAPARLVLSRPLAHAGCCWLWRAGTRMRSGLRNDDEAETFPVRHRVGDAVFPCQYVKIVPLLAWGANFNFSIWYVMLRGINDPAFVREGTRAACCGRAGAKPRG